MTGEQTNNFAAALAFTLAYAVVVIFALTMAIAAIFRDRDDDE